MSRSYRVLALALVGVLVLVALARLVGGNHSDAAAGDTTVVETVSTAAASTMAPTTVAPTTVAPTTVAPATVAPSTVPPAPAAGCTASGASSGVDRVAQRAWLCQDGVITATFPITSAWTMPDPGAYPIYAKDLHASSNFGGHPSTMTHFIAFSYGKNTGARVAFHSVPVLSDGEYVQPLSSVGDPGRRGESSGCIRVLPDDAVMLWNALEIGDVVTVLT